MKDEVRDNATALQFELRLDGATAFVTYRKAGSVVQLLHTEVPQELSGRGLGSRLAKGTLELLRKSGAQVVADCQFIAEYVKKHPEYQDLFASGETSRLDARLDEALQETFPASDPTAVSSRR
jgi:predicted GNAT family acetyltransferase